jgi:hypothetical protein
MAGNFSTQLPYLESRDFPGLVNVVNRVWNMAKKVSNMRKARGGEDGVMGWIRHKVVRYPNPHDTYPLLDSVLTVVFFALLGGWSRHSPTHNPAALPPQFQFDAVVWPALMRRSR